MSAKIPKVPGMSWDQVEKVSVRSLQQLAPEIGEALSPIPIREILEFRIVDLNATLGISERIEPVAEGNTIWNIADGKFEILLSPSVYEDLCNDAPRARMTGAHELGHLLLHPKQIKAIFYTAATSPFLNTSGFFRSRQSINPWEDPERQAAVFAGRFLLPKDSIFKAIYQDGLNNARELAQTFRVSQQAMAIRLGELGIEL